LRFCARMKRAVSIQMAARIKNSRGMSKRTLSLRSLILVIFILSLFVSVSGYGALIYLNWMSSAGKTTESILPVSVRLSAANDSETSARPFSQSEIPLCPGWGKCGPPRISWPGT